MLPVREDEAQFTAAVAVNNKIIKKHASILGLLEKMEQLSGE